MGAGNERLSRGKRANRDTKYAREQEIRGCAVNYIKRRLRKSFS